MKVLFPISILFLLISCDKNIERQKNSSKETTLPINPSTPVDSLTVLETFVDSTTIGNKGKNKLTAIFLQNNDESFIQLYFYSFLNDDWTLKNQFEFEKDGLSGIDPKIVDFNNDSHLDFHFNAFTAARGANDVRRLFIYDPKGDSLIYIKNSIRYPNMVYNDKLECIDAWMIHACSSQAFLTLENDSLIDFAWIENGDRISIYEVDKNGQRNLIKHRPSYDGYDCYKRFQSYDPLIEYPEEFYH